MPVMMRTFVGVNCWTRLSLELCDKQPQTHTCACLQLREVVAYASERHIEVVPEIELPGHCGAALASYPNLSCALGTLAEATCALLDGLRPFE